MTPRSDVMAPRDDEAAAADYAVTGDLHVTPDGGIDGWVWSRDRPGQRLVAEILVDDARIAAVVAARPRLDLAGKGIGDGRHGFKVSLPSGAIRPDGPVVVTARERCTGRIFGRVVRDGPAIAPQHQIAIDVAQAQISALWAGLDAARPQASNPGRAARLREAFDGLSARLAVRARGGAAGTAAEIAAAHEGLRRQCGELILPLLGAPALSLVLPVGGDASLALRHLRALLPALAEVGAEVVLVDDGTDPRAALIPALAANVVYLREPAPHARSHGLLEATLAARGRTVALLEMGPEPPSGTALIALAGLAADAPRAVLLGPEVVAAAGRAGHLDKAMDVHCAPAPLGLLLALDRDLLRAAGSLDAAMRDGAGLDCVDLWLRCRLLGAQGLSWTEPPRAPAQPGRRAILAPAMQAEASTRAVAAFRQRWRQPGLEAAYA